MYHRLQLASSLQDLNSLFPTYLSITETARDVKNGKKNQAKNQSSTFNEQTSKGEACGNSIVHNQSMTYQTIRKFCFAVDKKIAKSRDWKWMHIFQVRQRESKNLPFLRPFNSGTTSLKL